MITLSDLSPHPNKRGVLGRHRGIYKWRYQVARNWTVTKDQFLTKEEVAKLYAVLRDAKDLSLQRKTHYCHVRDYFIIRSLFETGLRVFEFVELTVGDFRNGGLIVRKGKGNKKRNILLTKDTQRMLNEWIKIKQNILHEPIADNNFLFISERMKPYTTRGIRKRVKKWYSSIGLNESLSCHSARHSYISHMLAAGLDLATLRNNAGHSSLAITSIYSHSTIDDLGELRIY